MIAILKAAGNIRCKEKARAQFSQAQKQDRQKKGRGEPLNYLHQN
jgi:hypothetical protein